MDNAQSLDKPKDNDPKSPEGQSPKASDADQNVVKTQSTDEDKLAEMFAKALKAPKKGKKGGDDATGGKLSLASFLHVQPRAQDQMQPFERWAGAKVDCEQTLAEWEKLLQDFLDRPV